MKKIIAILLFASAVAFAAQTVSVGLDNQQTPATVTITWLPKTIVSSVTCPQTTLEAGTSMTCTATLNQAAPSNKTGTPTSSDITKITVDASVAVPKGATTFTFTATAIGAVGVKMAPKKPVK